MLVGDGFAERTGIDAKRRDIIRLLQRQQRKHQLREAVGFLEMRIAGHDKSIDAGVLIFPDTRRHGRGIPDQSRSRAATDQTDAGPKVRADLQSVAASAVQLRHALLTDRVHPREYLLRRSYGFVGDMLDQLVRGFPGLGIGFTDNDMKTNAEAELATAFGGDCLDAFDFFGDLRRRFAPRQILVDGIDSDIDAGIRRSPEIERRTWRLDRPKQQASVLDADVLPFNVDRLSRKQIAIDIQKLARHGIAFVMTEEDAVALVFDGVTAGDYVDQKPSVRHPVERCGHARGDARRLQAGPHSHEITQPFGPGRYRRSDHPGILAASPGRQQYAEIAELIGGLRDLAQIIEVDLASTDGGAEIATVAMGRQEPEDVGFGRLIATHVPGFLANSETVMALGMRPSARNVSASFCCSAITCASIGLMP